MIIKSMRFWLYQGKWGTNFIVPKILKKKKKKKKKKEQGIVHIFVFFSHKFHVKAKNRLLSPTAPFLEKIVHPHPYCQIRGSQSPPL